jgi:hypothetical protein
MNRLQCCHQKAIHSIDVHSFKPNSNKFLLYRLMKTMPTTYEKQ